MPRNFNNEYDYYGNDLGNLENRNRFEDKLGRELELLDDDRPTELQQAFGSSLPPSLRYGALSQTVPAASSKTRSRTRGSGRFDNANNNNDYLSRHNYLDPQWNVQTTGGRLESMRNRKSGLDDVVSIGSRESQPRRPTFGTRPLGRKTRLEPDPLAELGRLEAERIKLEAEREKVKRDRRASDEVVIDVGPGHPLPATVEEEDEDADDEDQEEDETGEVEEDGAGEIEEKKQKEKTDAEADVDSSSTEEAVLGLHTPGAIKRPQPRPFEEEITYFGPSPEDGRPVDTKLYPKAADASIPVYSKVHRKYLSRHTLRHYDLPWEYERGDRNYIIILREMDKDETEVLFDHTKRWRERRHLGIEQASSDSESGSSRVYRGRRVRRGRIFGEADSDDSDSSERDSVVSGTEKPFLVFDFDSRDPNTDNSLDPEDALEESPSGHKIQPDPPRESKLALSTLDCVFNAGYDVKTKDVENQNPVPGRIEIVPPGPISSPNALFHLSHIQQDTMDYEKFKKSVLNIRELRNIKTIIEDHLNYVQKTYEHLSDVGNMGRHMDPFVNRHSHKVRKHGDPEITTVCVPFVCLGKNHHTNIARLSFRSLLRMTQEDTSCSPSTSDNSESKTAHPARTLFQSLYAKSDSRRDLNQAICHVSDQPQGHYLYVSQLWALTIDKEVLITCSTLSKKELFGDVILAQPAISKGQPISPEKNYHIRAQLPDDSVWNFNQANCRTYFDFVAHFSEYTTTFATESEIVLKDEVIRPSQWPEVLAAAKNSTVTIKLRRVPMLFDEDDLDKVIIPETMESTLIRMIFGLVPKISQAQMDAAKAVINGALAPQPDSYDSKEHPEASDREKKTNVSDHRALHHAADQDSSNGKKFSETLDRHLLVLGTFGQAVQHRTQAAVIRLPKIAEIDTGLPRFVLDNFKFSPGSFADEDELFDRCGEVTPQTFIDSLNALIPQWLTLEDEYQSENPATEDSSGRVRSEDNITLDQWRPIALATLHNGLRSLISLSSLDLLDEGLPGQAFRKLLQAVLVLSTAFHELVQAIKTFPNPKQKSIYRHVLGLDDLFRASTELEVYSITYEAILERTGTATDEYLRLIKHCTTALLIAAKVAREHVLLGPRLERHLGEHADKKTLIDELNVTIGILNRTMDRKHKQSQAKTATAQNFLEREADVLSKEGWDKDIALTVLKTHFGELRVSHHAKLAGRLFKRTFDKALRADPNKTISNKAAALPLDIVNILLPRILHMPVYKNQDTLHMYNHYLTELESDILTGEASRKPLDKLRYLKHELNAFSIIQKEQLNILEALKAPMFYDTGSTFERSLYRIRHPGPPLLEKTIQYLELQNENIKGLDVLIDTLQGEAQAAISGIQDWRDNAAVVFTVITIIFLPLSFVASVLGMNTSEIRSMSLNQWVFWASAIPFTLLVICVTVYFVEIPPLNRWLEQKGILGHRRR